MTPKVKIAHFSRKSSNSSLQSTTAKMSAEQFQKLGWVIIPIFEPETLDGIVVNSNFPGCYSVSNFQYEERLNENKRLIKLLKIEYVSEFKKEFENLLSK